MVKIENLTELKQELERRKQMVKAQKSLATTVSGAQADHHHKVGMIAAFDEAISLVDSFIEWNNSPKMGD